VLAESVRLVLGMTLVGRLLGIEVARLMWQVAVFAATGLAVSAAVGSAASLSLSAGVALPGRVLFETLGGAATLVVAVILLVVRFPRYAPLQRFEAVRLWHGRVLDAMHMKVSHQ